MPDALPPLPEAFRARLGRDLGAAEASALERALAREPTVGLRRNPGRLSADDLAAATGWRLEPVPWAPDGHLLSRDAGARPGPPPGRHPLHDAGAYYLQDPAAMAVAESVRDVIDANDDPWVIDLAAAPGGKATHLASILGDRGLLVANDVHAGRVTALGQNLERWGVRNAIVTHEAPAALAAAWGACFDVVVLDAPCSGEGMFRKSADARTMWSPEAVIACAVRQRDLLDDALALLRPGGRLVYSTCTFAPEENEGVIADLLTRRRDLELEAVALPGVDAGRPAFAPDGTDPERARSLARLARIWPHRHAGEGHVVARLVRRGPSTPEAGNGAPGHGVEARGPRGRDSERSTRAGAKRTPDDAPLDAQVRDLWRAFVDDVLGRDPVEGVALERHGDLVVAVPAGPDLAGRAVLRRGLHLGRVRRGRRRGAARFEPDHALAHALHETEMGRRLDLALDDPRLPAYLMGHELDVGGSDGWTVVTVLGCPLGWGYVRSQRMRNELPKGLRWP